MQNICRILQLTGISIMAVERDKSRREWMLLRMSTRDSVPLKVRHATKITCNSPRTHDCTAAISNLEHLANACWGVELHLLLALEKQLPCFSYPWKVFPETCESLTVRCVFWPWDIGRQSNHATPWPSNNSQVKRKNNRPRSIYQYSSMAPRLSGQNC